MAHYFTLSQAQRLIPEVERLLRDALFYKNEYQKAHDELERTNERIRTAGGSRVNHGALLSLRARRDTSASTLQQVLEDIQETGALVKDLDIGLIDFLTMYGNREVCLCWKLGEDAIRFWHDTEEGFSGRKPIDQEFMEQHRGNSTN
jgi:hypothetical protein